VESSEYPAFVGPHWGFVTPFALEEHHKTDKPGVWLDPPDPPMLTPRWDAYKKPIPADLDYFRMNHSHVAIFSSYLDPDDGVMIDISPASIGPNPFLTGDGHGNPINPKTGKPYEPQIVPRGDYTRILAEFCT